MLKCRTWKGPVWLKELLTAKVDLHCHCSDFSLPTWTILYAVRALFTSALHSRHHPDRIRSLPLCLLEGISSPRFLLTSPSQVHQHEKSHSSPEDFVVQCSQCICMAAQFFALQESLSHAQTAGSNSDPRDTIQSLLCLAFWFLIDTFTARRR